MTSSSVRPVLLRGGVEIEDPLNVVLDFLEKWRLETTDESRQLVFGEADLRLANRGGARISAAEIAAILERRHAVERALRAIAPTASLTRAPRAVPWLPLRQLFDAFAEVRGVGFAKVTKALHPKRPALIPILDSVVQKYLEDHAVGREAPFGERAIGLVRSYKHDLNRNQVAMRALRQELARRGHEITEVRILDLLIWSACAT